MTEQPGPWRVTTGRMPSGRQYWSVCRDERGGLRFVLTTYNRTPRRWFTEQGARDACAYWLRLEREAAANKSRAAALAASRAHMPPSWPFPVSAHDWSS